MAQIRSTALLKDLGRSEITNLKSPFVPVVGVYLPPSRTLSEDCRWSSAQGSLQDEVEVGRVGPGGTSDSSPFPEGTVRNEPLKQ